MAKRPLVEFILQVINAIFTLWGLGTLGYGLVCFFKWKQNPSKEIHESNAKYMIAHRLLLAIEPPKHSSDLLPKAWFIYLIIGIGAILFMISCFGYVGTASRSPCCLLSYCLFLFALVIVEIGTTAFIFLDHNWKEVIAMILALYLRSVFNRAWYDRSDEDDKHVVYLPRARTPNYRQLPPTSSTPNYRQIAPTSSTPLTPTGANVKDSTKPTKLQ